jgi:hypothetical protein
LSTASPPSVVETAILLLLRGAATSPEIVEALELVDVALETLRLPGVRDSGLLEGEMNSDELPLLCGGSNLEGSRP